MMPARLSRLGLVLAVSAAFVWTAVGLPAQEGAVGGEWRTYGGDLANTRYSPLDQITRDNFKDLEVAWRFKTENFGPRPEFNFEGTPLMVNGVLYTTAGTRRAAVALDAATGETLWMHAIEEGERGSGAPRRLSGRGLAYWDGGGAGQIFYITPGYQLIALDAKTGHRIRSFGEDGILDLKQGLDQEVDPVTGEIGFQAAPVVAGGIVIVGAAHLPGGAPKTKENVKGYVRGFDARTGKRLWTFHTIPLGDEFGNDTWLNESWRYTGNTGMWTQVAVDEDLGYAYLPLEMPTGDYYGGHRWGDNLFADSLVAVDLKTGERVWHYQTVHHDVWDYDLPCGPILADITVDGRAVKAIAQPTKQGFLFVLDRVTGQPVWPIEERPVQPSDVPGERLSPTQPVPTRPPPYERQGTSVDDLIDFTPELKAEALKIASQFRMGPIFTPPSVSVWGDTLGTLAVPSSTGGVNWPGGSLDPETGILYLYSKNEVTSLGLLNNPERSTMNFISGRAQPPAPAGGEGTRAGGGGGGAPGGGGGEGGGGGGLNVQGIPLVKPPWARISAIDLNKGEILWQVAHGDTPDNIRDHELLKGIEIPRTGRPGRVGTLVTRTLLIAGEAGFATTPMGRGAMLRAYDKRTGDEVGAVYMPAPQTGSPMTYLVDGRQHIVVAISGGGFPGELIAYRLPREN